MMRNLASHAQQLEIQKVQVKSSNESSNSNEHTSTKSQSEIENLKQNSMSNLKSSNEAQCQICKVETQSQI
jgi:hypothetical protein